MPVSWVVRRAFEVCASPLAWWLVKWGAGHSIDDILVDYPYLERDDVLQALRYAAWRSDEREVALLSA